MLVDLPQAAQIEAKRCAALAPETPDPPAHAVHALSRFFACITPADERALRSAFGMEPNPELEDITASPHATSAESVVLLSRVRACVGR